MTDLMVRESADVAVQQYSPAMTSLATWAMEAQAAHTVAISLAKTSFVPKGFQGRPDEITAAILVGQEIGLSPMAALRSIVMVHGTPSLTANAMRGIVQAKGHKIWVESESATKAVVCGQRLGDDKVQRSEWTIQRADQAGFPAKNPNWKSQPQNMLVSRATSTLARMIAADALLGLAYSKDELEDGLAPEPKRRTVARKAVSAGPKGEPELSAPSAAERAVQVGDDGDDPGLPEDIWNRYAWARNARGWDEDRGEEEFGLWSDGDALGGASDQQVNAFIEFMGGAA